MRMPRAMLAGMFHGYFTTLTSHAMIIMKNGVPNMKFRGFIISTPGSLIRDLISWPIA